MSNPNLYGLRVNRGDFGPRSVMTVEPETSAAGNTVIRVGHEFADEGDVKFSAGWSKTEHVVITPDQLPQLIADLSKHLTPEDRTRANPGPAYLYLDASTAHLPQSERDLLENAGRREERGLPPDNLPRIISHRYGWWVHVNLESDFEDERDYTDLPAFAALVAHAQSLGCGWINVDADADQIDGLDTFDE